jgi:phage terminase large subunit
VLYDPAAPVWTSWDLGIRDATAIWCAQVIGREIRIIAALSPFRGRGSRFSESIGQPLARYHHPQPR